MPLINLNHNGNTFISNLNVIVSTESNDGLEFMNALIFRLNF